MSAFFNRVDRLPSSRGAAALFGIGTLVLWPTHLSAVTLSALVIILLMALFLARGRLPTIAALCAGVVWGLLATWQAQNSTLSEKLDRAEFSLQGQVISPIIKREDYWQFDLRLEQLRAIGEMRASDYAGLIGKKIRLRIYLSDKRHLLQPSLCVGCGIEAVARLRTPRGSANPGLFNYRAWLLSQGYAATGYLRSYQVDTTAVASIDGFIAVQRQQVLSAVQRAGFEPLTAALMAALAVGDKSALAPWRERIVALGIIHLLVISGLHVGIVAGLGWWLGYLLSRGLSVWLSWRGDELRWGQLITLLAPTVAIIFSLLYTLLAGAQLPAVRAFIAVVWVAVATARAVQWSPHALFVKVVLTILIFDPLAVISASFWLSLAAVMLLLLILAPRRSITNPDSKAPKLRTATSNLLRIQLYLSLGMAPLMLAMIGKLSWLGWLLNLLAVPWVTLLLVPATLVAVGLTLTQIPLATALWQLVAWLCAPLVWVIEKGHVDSLWLSADQLAGPVWSALLVLGLGVLAPRALLTPVLRMFSALPLLMLLVREPHRPPLRVTVLDVGQGLAVVIEAAGKVLLYDSGARYGELFNMGSAVVVPFLQRRGYQRVERILISHGDNDHAGGLTGLLQVYPEAQLLLPENLRSAYSGAQSCQNALSWQWGDVEFHTLENGGDAKSNNNSCLLVVKWQGVKLLLPGDIERRAEQKLIGQRELIGPTDLLLAPHHGSKTSSSREFLNLLAPAIVIFSAGWNHHYGHPHPQVVARYRQIGSQIYSTGIGGAITVTWTSAGQPEVVSARAGWSPWWRY